MLHAVAVGPRQIVGDEGVGVPFERRIFAEDVARLAHDLFDAASKGVDIRVAAGVMNGHPEDAACVPGRWR